jgi:hypothetical protein
MFGVRDDLIIPLDGVDPSPLLETWRWKVPEELRPWFATALGDLFLRGPGGEVVWLDVGGGELEEVADSEEAFAALAADPDNASVWFGEVLIDQLRAAGQVLAPGQCYTYLTPPILDGEYEPGNFRIKDLATHFQIWGPIHEKIKDLPDGATIEFHVTD